MVLPQDPSTNYAPLLPCLLAPRARRCPLRLSCVQQSLQLLLQACKAIAPAQLNVCMESFSYECLDIVDFLTREIQVSTRILGRRTAPFSPFLIPHRVPHGLTPRS